MCVLGEHLTFYCVCVVYIYIYVCVCVCAYIYASVCVLGVHLTYYKGEYVCMCSRCTPNLF